MTGRLGQNGRSRPVLPGADRGPALVVLAALLVASLVAGVLLVLRGADPARAATFLAAPRAVTLTLVDGSSTTPTTRTRVPAGATVATAPGGSVSLESANRVVLLGSDTAVTVLDGVRERLVRGLVMVDARRTGDLALDAGAATVRTPRGSLVRVERAVLLRVASFRGTPTVQAMGRKAQADVTALHQVQVPYGGLPGRVTALALTRDGWERRFALALVTVDIDLNQLAAALDGDASARAAVAVPASYLAALPVPDGASAGEQVLTYVVAQASSAPGLGGYARVRALRDQGGSWGVVAALVGADADAVSAALDRRIGPSQVTSALGLPTGPGTSGPVAQPAPSGRPVPGSSATPTPRPSVSPSPDPLTPIKPVTDPLRDVVGAVVSALPAPVRSLVPQPLSSTVAGLPVVGPLLGPIVAPLLP